MKIQKDCKVESCVSTDPGRIAINHILIDRNEDGSHVAVATDGRRLVRVTVDLEEGDEPGLLPVEALKEARKRTHGSVVSFSANGDIKLPCGISFPRPGGEEMRYPNYRQVFPTDPPKFRIALNAKALAEVASALGGEIVTLGFTDELSVIQISGKNGSGLLMPCRMT